MEVRRHRYVIMTLLIWIALVRLFNPALYIEIHETNVINMGGPTIEKFNRSELAQKIHASM